jgi:hypothetical protein
VFYWHAGEANSVVIPTRVFRLGWRVKQEYTFAIEGRSLAGIPQLKHQYSGVHFRGNLLVQSQHAALLVMAVIKSFCTNLAGHR